MRSRNYVFTEIEVEFIIKRNLDLIAVTGAKTSTMINGDPDKPCIIAGDFNLSNSALGLLLKRHITGYIVLDFSGSSKSFFGNGDKTWSSINHIIVNEAAKGLVRNARVNRGYNISDHWLILDSLLSTPERLDSMQKEICYHNFWAPLEKLYDTSTMEADEIAANFVEKMKKIAVGLALYKASNRKLKRFYITP
ncbi:hypothetical protein AYI69_g10600 [Smittium culicis]|uniref:Endonuclease/exonuclease/phosphatase domain-containing protein n=1 Tax=Smittium culicis TaxID=133412 RepID=A0A1R1X4M8_9FUNG|nr:hypothetical protein AYI69_g10600 [Smittium culicis]